jgi:RNA recognition motif-containing protein
MNIYVGNLSRDVTEDDLREAFEEFGEVSSVSIITDKFTGASRGFGFVEMPDGDAAQEAMNSLNGKDLKGRSLNVNEAKPKTDRPRATRTHGRVFIDPAVSISISSPGLSGIISPVSNVMAESLEASPRRNRGTAHTMSVVLPT